MMEFGAELLRILLRPELYHALAVMFAMFAENAAATLLTAIWQGAAITLFLALCLRFVPRIPASLRFVLLAGGFAANVALPFLPLVIARTGRAPSPGQAAAAVSAHPWLVVDARWSVALTLLWLAASLWRGVDLGLHSFRLRRLWMQARPATMELAGRPERASELLPKLRGRRPIEICTTVELERPSVIGFLAPRILIPAWLLERMTQAELEQIVLHETEHLRRGDDWTNLLQKIGMVLFPLNPALVWMERRLCLEREMACDEGVVRRTRAPRAYAACLTNLAEHGLDRQVQALSLGAWQRRPELARRVHRLLAKKPALRPAAALGIVALLSSGLIAGSAELARCPQMIGFASHTPVSHHAPVFAGNDHAYAVASVAQEGDRVLYPEMQNALRESTGPRSARAVAMKAVAPVVAGSAAGLAKARPVRGLRQDFPALEGGHEVFTAADDKGARYQELPNQEARLNREVSLDGRNLPKLPGAGAHAQAEDEPAGGWVVMTTMWEQTETNSPQPISESPAESNGNASAGESTVRRAGQVIFTRLVWHVAPQTQDAAAGVDASKTAAAGSTQDKRVQAAPRPMPAIVPVRGGWLIFQL